MENHLLDIVRFFICIVALTGGLDVMLKTDSDWLRRTAALLASLAIYFNYTLGSGLYLLLGSLIELLLASIGVGFVIVAALAIMVLPVIIIIHKLMH